MKRFPCAKINLGLNVVSKRDDGYHNIETVFYPIPLCDELDVTPIGDEESIEQQYILTTTGDIIDAPTDDNLVIKAYRLLAEKYPMPKVKIHLHKHIPSQAGLGGGSSDATAMLLLLNEQFNLGINKKRMLQLSAQLGADCPFFVEAEPVYATGTGNIFTPLVNSIPSLKGKYLLVVKPDIAVSTGKAYSMLTPKHPEKCCREIINNPINTWKYSLTNDFEKPVFKMFPRLATIKHELYEMGAIYAQMSGSGSALFGIFDNEPPNIDLTDAKTFTMNF